jgi:hypothetical protein
MLLWLLFSFAPVALGAHEARSRGEEQLALLAPSARTGRDASMAAGILVSSQECPHHVLVAALGFCWRDGFGFGFGFSFLGFENES